MDVIKAIGQYSVPMAEKMFDRHRNWGLPNTSMLDKLQSDAHEWELFGKIGKICTQKVQKLSI